MKLYAKDSGVSPVIGTILLVAITVVLVAIIAAVVMGMSSGVSNTKEVGLTVIPVGLFPEGTTLYFPGVKVILMGGKDVDSLRKLTVFVEGSVANAMYLELEDDGITGKLEEDLDPISNPVGNPFFYVPLYKGAGIFDNVLVIVKGTFDDGTEHILYQSRLTLPAPPSTEYTIVTVNMEGFDFNTVPTSPRFV